MKDHSKISIVLPGKIKAFWAPIERFFFTPRDPTLLGLIRVLCGAVTLYTVLAYSFTLDDLIGKHAWWGLDDRLDKVRNFAYSVSPLHGTANPPRSPQTKDEEWYWNYYKTTWLSKPPPPYPVNNEQVKFADDFLFVYGYDFRGNGLPFPSNKEEEAFLHEFAREFRAPPSRFPKDPEDRKAIFNYVRKFGDEPHRVYARGAHEWSVWFHIPTEWMIPIHAGICFVTFLFTIGFCTRVTSVLTWMGQLCYIHRAPHALFGVDAMMVIILLYLMIGASGAALSVDRLIANRRRKKMGLPPAPPEPSVSAGFALRLIQIHVCIIYCAAGLSKLQGRSWWNGTAVWGTLANWEFAPMQYSLYLNFLWTIGSVGWVYHLFMTTAGYFTLVFEIGYPALIWNRYTRWFILGMAVILHGLIGLFMGLKTFALMMLFMNMAFLTTKETYWLLGLVGIRRIESEKEETEKTAPKKSAPPRSRRKKKDSITVPSAVRGKDGSG